MLEVIQGCFTKYKLGLSKLRPAIKAGSYWNIYTYSKYLRWRDVSLAFNQCISYNALLLVSALRLNYAH